MSSTLFKNSSSLNSALQKKIKKEEEELWKKIDKNAQVLVIYGVGFGNLYQKAKAWLQEERERYLIFIEDDSVIFSHLLETEKGKEMRGNPQVEVFLWENVFTLEIFFKKAAWKTVFLKQSFSALSSYAIKESWGLVESLGSSIFMGVHLVASDYSDFGVKIFENMYRNLMGTTGIKLASSLKGRFKGIPAVICGAGPSLKKNGYLLKDLASKALLFAGGSALNVLEGLSLSPSFAAALDKEAPYSTCKRQIFWDTPFFFQARVSHEHLSLVHGEKLFVPGSGGYPLERWLFDELSLSEESIDGGWNVATLLIKLAHDLGCSPIILTGMDLSYTENLSYAEGEGLLQKEIDSHLISCKDLTGKEVLTQKDWLMAAKWVGEFAEKHPGIFFNCTEGGIGFGELLPNVSLEKMKESLLHSYDLKGMVHQVLADSATKEIERERADSLIKRIEGSLFLADILCDQAFQQLEKAFEESSYEDYEHGLDEELSYQELLQPLWEIWKHIFARQIAGEDKEEWKMEMQRLLFFKQVIAEHLPMVKRVLRK